MGCGKKRRVYVCWSRCCVNRLTTCFNGWSSKYNKQYFVRSWNRCCLLKMHVGPSRELHATLRSTKHFLRSGLKITLSLLFVKAWSGITRLGVVPVREESLYTRNSCLSPLLRTAWAWNTLFRVLYFKGAA